MSASAAPVLVRPRFTSKPSLLVFGLLLVPVIAFWPSWTALVHTWTENADYHHGYLVAVAMAAWLWRSRTDIDATVVRPTPAALIVLALCVLFWAVAFNANSALLEQAVMPVIWASSVWAVFGWRVIRQVWQPLFFFWCAVPVWEAAVPVLQLITTHVAEGTLVALGVPVTVSGNEIAIPAGRFVVVEDCSGKRYFVVGLTFGIIAAAMHGLVGARLVAMVGLAAIVAMITNWVRVVSMILAGHLTDMQHHLITVEHSSLGYALFAPMIVAIMYAPRLFRARPAARSAPSSVMQAGRRQVLTFAAVLVTLALPVQIWAARGSLADWPQPRLGPIPLLTAAWTGPLPANTPWRPRFVGASDERMAAYSDGLEPVFVYLNAYGRQAQGHELVYYENSLAPPESDWRTVRRQEPLRGDLALLNATDAAGQGWVIAYAWRVGGVQASHPALAQFWYGLLSIFRSTPSGIVALAAPCATDCGETTERLTAFWRSHGEALLRAVPESVAEVPVIEEMT